ncbi:mandelate racemase/muconate lactonizing enzyme family protein [Fulvimarina sp. 2208YS6-2-32]|uniref:Mandelate racemase/muconate lactonizing enzyme family protein n=1 Tax=Fulvimarina uroteuthidis TaxID=3098149 RepID=A0ABU5I9U8_9HYPH|nr:mandelate racemase/muconate lactonizing enzyme family protein [Fulvimarina sp. 2208YS6-2-32]MDY8111036.1 mandelate racemase/muconate lactonizing enzyme family protein [Fulvimarina sp. 2208YS6-2-32]
MKIATITPFAIRVGTRNQLLVKIDTDEGVFGWGESGLSGRERAVMGALEHFSRWLVGQDAFRIGRIWQELYRSQYFEGGRVLTAAMSAIDLALHDVKGKALGVPVYDLLGGRQRDHVPTFATTSAPPGEEMIAQARDLLAAGWTAIRLSPSGHENPDIFEPREHIGKTAHWLARAREELGSDVVLGIDWHHRLSVAEAASFCQKMPAGTLDFLEEPIRDESPSSYEALRRMTDIPFAIGEEFASKWQFLPYIERDIHQFNRIDICNVGGLTEAMKVAGWSEAHYVDMMPHNPLGPICTAATVHFAAAVPNFSWLETRSSPAETHLGFDSAEFFPVQPRLDGAVYPVSDLPGLGVEVDEDRVRASAFAFWEAPHLTRRDGSITNW